MSNMSNTLLKARSSAAARVQTPALPLVSATSSSVVHTSSSRTTCKRIRHILHRRSLSLLPSDVTVVCGAQPTSSVAAASGLGLFPSGAQQTRVQLPAVVLQVEASQVLSDPAMTVVINQALQGGCNMLVLWDSQSNAAAMYDAALRIQDLLRGRAALLLVDRTDIALAIGAQGVLLTDQGVPTVVARRMLSGSGSAPGSGPGASGSGFGALVGRVVADEAAAVTAAADGASLLLVTGPGGSAPSAAVLTTAKSGQRSGNAIPVIMSVRVPSSSSSTTISTDNGSEGDVAGSSGDSSSRGLVALSSSSSEAAALQADMDGVAVSPEALPVLARACFDLPETSGVTDFTTAILTRLNVKAATSGAPKRPLPPPHTTTTTNTTSSSTSTPPSSPSASSATQQPQQQPQPRMPAPAPAAPLPSSPPAVTHPRHTPTHPPAAQPQSLPLRRLLDPAQESLLAAEKEVLAGVMEFLEQTLPGVSELSLLRDALKSLDEPFLVAVVGEFNSGKSSVINALLGRRYLAEGILPTTNEISILKYAPPPGTAPPAAAAAATSTSTSSPASTSSPSSSLGPRLEQQADGLYVRYLPAKLLQDLHIVDTPGTNVILERQQRLTEEYVPRADLVLFVMSADRPFSESEVRFLEYIRQWRKRVLFVVNKVDLLGGRPEVTAVCGFVADNARRLLQLDRPDVVAVSSRLALRAKLQAAGLPTTAPAVSSPASTSPVSDYTLDYYTSLSASTDASDSPSTSSSHSSNNRSTRSSSPSSSNGSSFLPSSSSSSSPLSLPAQPHDSLASADAEEADVALRASPVWFESGFGELERQVANYLVGKGGASSSSTGGEGV
ncbi:hypothetical protein Agub_g3373, partial [Astrephomene gubernaculifera]